MSVETTRILGYKRQEAAIFFPRTFSSDPNSFVNQFHREQERLSMTTPSFSSNLQEIAIFRYPVIVFGTSERKAKHHLLQVLMNLDLMIH